jgi:tetratricopeptide (TPR) repeat protein
MATQPLNTPARAPVRFPLAVPIMTAFASNVAFMVFEIVAGRLIARTFGTSLYTWTSVIGVCLAGMAVGNYLGGRVADRYRATRALSAVFLIGSISCVAVLMLSHTTEDWHLLYGLTWPQRISTHALILFFVPTTLIGMVSPIATRLALDAGLGKGRTVGSVYAISTVGAIGGTFLAGFWLIPALGSTNVLWLIAGWLAVMAVLLRPRDLRPYAWSVAMAILVAIGIAPNTKAIAAEMALRFEPHPDVIYEKESHYSYITVRQVIEEGKDQRQLWMDQLCHSSLIMSEPTNLLGDYRNVYADVTARHLPEGRLTVMNIGGGGYTFPRYLQLTYPDPDITVVEIDPAVPQAAQEAFGLAKDTQIQLVNMDGRNYVEQLLREKSAGKPVPAFDFIYCDAANHFSVPFHMTTLEFAQKVKSLLKPTGVYLLTTLDMYEIGRYSGAIMNTFRACFQYVEVISPSEDGLKEGHRDHFIVIGSDRPLNLEGLGQGGPRLSPLKYTRLDQEHYDAFAERSNGLVLRDDYAPVENLLGEVAKSESQAAFIALYEDGLRLADDKKLDRAEAKYRYALKFRPDHIPCLINLGILLHQTGRPEEAMHYFKQAETHDPENALIHFNIAGALSTQGQSDEVLKRFQRAIELKPDYFEAHNGLGNAYFNLDEPGKAAQHYQKSLAIQPNQPDAPTILHNLAVTLVQLDQPDEALAAYEKALDLNANYPLCLINLGRLHQAHGRINEARAAYEKALALEPRNAEIQKLIRQLSSR